MRTAPMPRRLLAAFLALVLSLTCVPEALAAESATAVTMQLMKTEGTVGITNASGRKVSLVKNMKLRSGYHVATEEESYSWINLDSAKLIKEDAVTEISIRKSGKKLEVLLDSGNLFFNVTEPLDEDESLNIRTSTMIVGIRGTSGWVKIIDQWTSELYILEGTVTVTVTDPVTGETKTDTVTSGEKVVCKVYPQDTPSDKCEIIRDTYTADGIDGFVLVELAQDQALREKVEAASGLKLDGVDAAKRLKDDQTAVHQKLEQIKKQAAQQENNISVEPVWTDPQPDKADTKPETTKKPSGSTGGSGGNYIPTPTPSDIVTLTMPQEDDTVNDYLSRSTVKGVVLVPGPASQTLSSTANLLEVDSGLTVPAGKTLTLQSGVGLELLAGQAMQVSGAVTVNGAFTVRGTLTPSTNASIRAWSFALIAEVPGWKVSETQDSQGFYTLVPGDDADLSGKVGENVYWSYTKSTKTLRIWGTGPMEDFDAEYGYPDGGIIPVDTSAPWFDFSSEIQTLVLEDGITSIGDHAFTGFTNATGALKIPDTVTRIGIFAFHEWYNMDGTLTLPSGLVSIGDYAFCFSDLKGPLTLPDSLTSIGECAFFDCSSLTGTLKIPPRVTNIGFHAFGLCKGFTGMLTLPSSMTRIEGDVFSCCDGLTGVTIPVSITEIDSYAFYSCDNLTDVYYGGTEEQWEAVKVNANGNDPLLNAKFHFQEIPAATYTITFNANGGTPAATSVKTSADGTVAFPADPTRTGYTFNGWFSTPTGGTAVTEATVFEKDTTVYAQWGEAADGVTWRIENGTLYIEGSGAMEDYTYSSQGFTVDTPWFARHEEIKAIVIGNQVTSIGAYSFYGLNYATSVTIPDSVVSIGTAAFWNCSNLTSATIPTSVSNISNSMFQGCTKLTDVKIPEGVTAIGNSAFQGCRYLPSITIPEGVTSIGTFVFVGCNELASVTIPASMRSIGDNAFNGCTALTDAYYPGTEAQWNSSVTVGTQNEPLLNALRCSDTPSNVTWRYDESTRTLYIEGSGPMEDYSNVSPPWQSYFADVTTLIIGDGVTSISNRAFVHFQALSNVTIPNSVTSIGNHSFAESYALSEITLPEHLTSIGDYAFSASSLTSVTIPDGVTSIGTLAFSNCSSLMTSITIPNSVTSIGNRAFYGCGKITSVTISSNVTSIGEGTFNGCSSLTSLTIPDSIISIGDSAFEDCHGLTSVTIPDSITHIGYRTFYRCDALTSVTIPDSVTSIGESAFNECLRLADVYYGGTEAQWNAITIDAIGNGPLTSATIHYNSPMRQSIVSDAAPGYVDVPDDAWYAEAVAYCREHGLMNGTSATEFSPDATLTRAMTVTVLHRLAGTPAASTTEAFTDVEAGQWYTQAVSWANSKGIVQGYGDGTFGVTDPVTHEQVRLIFQRYSGDSTVQTIGADTPNAPATRAEIAATLMDFAGRETLEPGKLSVFSAMNIMCSPSGVAADRDGSLLVTDLYHKQVWRVVSRDSRSYAGGATVQDLYGQPVGGYNDAALDGSYFKSPWAIAPFLDGWAVTDAENNAVRLIRAGGVQTVNGVSNEKLTVTKLGVAFDHPTGLASDSEGNLYVSDTFSGAVRKVTPEGGVTTVAKNLSDPTGLCWKNGVLYIAETGADRIVKVQDGKVSTVASGFDAPQGVAVGDDGTVYVADTCSGAVKKISGGRVTALAEGEPSELNGGLTSPTGLLLQGRKLYICDSFAKKVFVYQIG